MLASVGIFQNAIHLGGRLRVLISITEVLNEMNVEPEWVAFKIDVDGEEIKQKYRRNVSFSHSEISFPKLPYELEILAMNRFIKAMRKRYDLVISSNNSLALLGALGEGSIFYIHFPRKARLESGLSSVHFPEGRPISPFTLDGFSRLISKPLYEISSPPERAVILTNSKYTKECTLRSYPTLREASVEVVYPPVNSEDFIPSRKKKDTVVTLGRFEETKRQLEQLQIARMTPELEFRICGFIFSKRYFRKCQAFIEEEKIENAKLIPNISFNKAKELLSTSKFFLHNVRNEPFGISTVEAIHSGCVPVVHNSGGQKEIVNLKSLRFERAEQAAKILERLKSETSGNLEVIRQNLRSHAEIFSEASFKKAIRRKIEGLLA